MLSAADSGAVEACPLPQSQGAPGVGEEPAIKRRLRDEITTLADYGSAETDLTELTYVTASRPVPHFGEMVQVPGAGRALLRLTVVNNSRHASPDGGITLSFPGFTRPSDRSLIESVVVPEGMALHVIPAGGRVYGRDGLVQQAEHLMVEVHGPWQPRQSRTLEVAVSSADKPAEVRFRSAFSDAGGTYQNTPVESLMLDQQGWPARTCTFKAGGAAPVDEERLAAQSANPNEG